jgi:hypothetical protein
MSTISAIVQNGGKTLHIAISKAGNYREGDQEGATKKLDEFKEKLLEKLKQYNPRYQ